MIFWEIIDKDIIVNAQGPYEDLGIDNLNDSTIQRPFESNKK